jgi:hypothetical protein
VVCTCSNYLGRAPLYFSIFGPLICTCWRLLLDNNRRKNLGRSAAACRDHHTAKHQLAHAPTSSGAGAVRAAGQQRLIRGPKRGLRRRLCSALLLRHAGAALALTWPREVTARIHVRCVDRDALDAASTSSTPMLPCLLARTDLLYDHVPTCYGVNIGLVKRECSDPRMSNRFNQA